MVREFVPFEEGWSEVEVAIDNMKRILEGEPGLKFDFRDATNLYTIIYNLCVQKFPPYYSVYSENFHYCDYSEKLYSRYRETIEDYCKQTVVQSLRKKLDGNFLDELALRWSNHKCLIRWLSRGFSYLDRYYIMRRSLPTLNQVGLTCFHDLVYKEIQPRATEAVIALIHKEREGEEIDRALLKNILEMYVEMGMGHMDKYEDDFESSMLQDTESYYSSKVSSWIKEDSCPEYMLKAEECLEKERERVTHYLHESTEPKLLEKVENELLVVVAKQLIENEHSGCRALLRDGEMNDLSRMYRLYHKFPQALDTIVDIYKQHATAEAIVISKQFKDKATNPQVLLHKADMLYDKCLVCHTVCFKDSSARFEEVLKEAFETFSI